MTLAVKRLYDRRMELAIAAAKLINRAPSLSLHLSTGGRGFEGFGDVFPVYKNEIDRYQLEIAFHFYPQNFSLWIMWVPKLIFGYSF